MPPLVNTTSPGSHPRAAATTSRASSTARRASRRTGVGARRVAEPVGEERQHGRDRLGPHRRRRRVVEVGDGVHRTRLTVRPTAPGSSVVGGGDQRQPLLGRTSSGRGATAAPGRVVGATPPRLGARRAPRPARRLDAVEGYDAASYGRGIADVYDDWYADVTDVGATVARVVALAGGPGAGCSSSASAPGASPCPLAAAGLRGARRRRHRRDARPPAGQAGRRRRPRRTGRHGRAPSPPGAVRASCSPPTTRCSTCTSAAAQQAVPGGGGGPPAARRLRRRGGVRARPTRPTPTPACPRRPSRSATCAPIAWCSPSPRTDRSAQTERGPVRRDHRAGGVRLRPWRIRCATPAQLDAMAAAAGLVLAHRSAGWRGEPFDDDSTTHVSVWQREADHRLTARSARGSGRPVGSLIAVSQLRLNPLTGRWVTVVRRSGGTPERLRRPDAAGRGRPGRPCPFCPGNEEATPPALETYGPRRAAGWCGSCPTCTPPSTATTR